jgi:AcrR family transcriptional regulator
MGVAERKARHKTELRQEILEAARDLFVNEGYRHVSMRRIAEKIEYSPTTIYLYFKDKEDLMFQVCEDTFRQLSEQFEALHASKAAAESVDPVEYLRKGLEIYVNFGLNHPNHYKVAFLTEPEREQESAKYCQPDTMAMRAFGYLRQAVEECVVTGQFREDVDTDLASEALWSAVHGVTALMVQYPEFPWSARDRLVPEVINRMIAGFRK